MPRKVLLVEPDYRSKFPPIGLMRISSYHKMRGDRVVFTRGQVASLRAETWDRIYVSSLFTWELPRTVDTVKYYQQSAPGPEDIYVGGVAASLLPDYIRNNVTCRVVEGLLDKPGQLDAGSLPVTRHPLDYSLLDAVDYPYQPKDAYFCKVTIGCIRKCSFCAVPILEPKFGLSSSLTGQIKQIQTTAGDKHDLVLLDNNVLGIEGVADVFAELRSLGFSTGSREAGRLRTVDFNQGLDARLVTPEIASMLGSVNIAPVRLAFDHEGIEKDYRRAVTLLAEQGLREFTNYLLFNFTDSPSSIYKRIQVNLDLNLSLGVTITGFPMRFIPMDNVKRNHIGKKWRWRWLRGMQCVLLATRGLVSPNAPFVARAFGESFDEFLEILSMPDRYIIFRKSFENAGAEDWRRQFRKLSPTEREEFLEALSVLNKSRTRQKDLESFRRFSDLLEHYYPGGRVPKNGPPEAELSVQGLATGYDILDPAEIRLADTLELPISRKSGMERLAALASTVPTP